MTEATEPRQGNNENKCFAVGGGEDVSEVGVDVAGLGARVSGGNVVGACRGEIEARGRRVGVLSATLTKQIIAA